MNRIQFPRFSTSTASATSTSSPEVKEKTLPQKTAEPQVLQGAAPASAHAHLRKAGSGTAFRLYGMWKPNAKEGAVEKQKTPLHDKTRINGLSSEKRIYADHVTQLNLDEIAAMTSALSIPWMQDIGTLEKSIAGRLNDLSELMNCVLNHSTSAHGIVRQQSPAMAVLKDETLDHGAFQRNFGMSAEQARILKRAKKQANMDIVLVGGHDKLTLALYFDSSRAASGWKENAQALAFKGRLGRNNREIVNTALGTHGDAFAAVKDAAAVLAEMSEKGNLRIDMVAGHSLGGGYAQYFKAAYESRAGLGKDKPAMVLLDPMLLNDSQAADAVRGTPHGYDYSAPRGIAVTLDNVKAPAKTLLSRMKGMGYKHPGLVELKLDVRPGDVARFEWTKNAQGDYLFHGDEGVPSRQRDNPSPGRLMGYHADTSVFEMAIHRFTSKTKR